MENTIKLNKKDTIRLNITTDEGIDTGEFLEFDLNDISLPLRYRDLIIKDKENRSWYKKETIIINKRQDSKGKGDYLSKNEEDLLKAAEEFFKKEVEIYNMFLGENGVEKLLNGGKLGWTSLQDIDELIKEQIIPVLNKNVKSMEDLIKQKYSLDKEEELV